MVAVVVLTWNQCDLTLDCLDSLARLDYPANRLQTIVVDNGSTDDSVVRIHTSYPDVEIIETGENMGYAEGNNAGMWHALQQGCDYVCVLNNDTVVAPGFLRALVDEAVSNRQVGLVGPKMYFSEPPDMVFAAGSIIDWSAGALRQRGIWKRESELGPLYSAPEDVDFIVGCGVLIRAEALETVGLFDSRYYLNFEDVDWCVRARESGYRVRYAPDAVLWHKVSASLGIASPRNTYYMTRNALLFFASHLDGWRRWRAVGRIVLRNLGHIAAWILKPEYRSSTRAKRQANALALRDAFLGRFGKMGPDVNAVCEEG
jgi:GT2 family glycosyltransferase